MAKKNNYGLIIILFVLVTSTLGVFQFISVKKFTVNLVVAMDSGVPYQEVVTVDDNSTALMALSKLMNVQVENESIKCVGNLCNEGNNSWITMTQGGIMINPYTYKLSNDELIYFMYFTNGTNPLTDTNKSEKDREALMELLKLS